VIFRRDKSCTGTLNHASSDYFSKLIFIAQKLTVLLDLLIALAKGGSKLEATTAQLARKPQV
jgi:hypothetical protein